MMKTQSFTAQQVFMDGAAENVAAIQRWAKTLTGKVGVLAGHFPLAVSPYRGIVIPHEVTPTFLQYDQPISNPYLRQTLGEFGDFAERTLAIGEQAVSKGWLEPGSKVWLIANDVGFRLHQSEAAQVSESDLNQMLTPLYRESRLPAFPAYFAFLTLGRWLPRPEQLFETHEGGQVILLESDLQRSFLSAERQESLVGRAGIKKAETSAKLYTSGSTCLITPQGQCCCSGTGVEILLRMNAAGYRNALLFIPEGCSGPLQMSIPLAIELGLMDSVLMISCAPWANSDLTIDLPFGFEYSRD